jgi:hypothetical protein
MSLLRSAFVIVVLTGCGTSSDRVEVIDLDKVLEVWDEVTKTPLEGVKAEAEPGDALDADAKEDTRAMAKLLVAFEQKLNERKLINGRIGARLKDSGSIQGYRDLDSDSTMDPGEKELFAIQIDAERERIVATSTVYEETYRRDRYYRRHHHGMGGILFYSWMLGRQNRYYSHPSRTRPRFGSMAMAPQNYHKSAVTKARSTARTRSRSSGSSSRSARSRSGSGSFSFGK